MTYAFFAPAQQDLAAVNQLVQDNLGSDVPLVAEIANYIVSAGGKRLRPLLVLLTALGCGYQGRQHLKLAAVIEFLHTAMLLHDDVIDSSDLRRGRSTANAAWGNPASVLVGDFLHSRAFQMMVEVGNLKVMQILSDATNVITEGEVQQLASVGRVDTSEAEYLQIIERKAARLFQAAAHIAAVLAGASPQDERTLETFGLHLGMAFQLTDDQLDYTGDTAKMGKAVGDDLKDGKATLPLIVALRNAAGDQRRFLQDAIGARSAQGIEQVVALVQETGGLEYTGKVARQHQQQALACLDCLPDSDYKVALGELTQFAVSRYH